MFAIEKKSQDEINKENELIIKLNNKLHTLNDDLRKNNDLLKDSEVEIKKFDNKCIKRNPHNSKIDNKDDINSLAIINLRKDKWFKNVFRAPKKYYLSLFKTHSTFFKTRSKSERKNIANSELETFVQTYFIEKDSTKILEWLTKKDLINLVREIVIPMYTTKKNSSYIFKKESKLYHNWIYKFNNRLMSILSYNNWNKINF